MYSLKLIKLIPEDAFWIRLSVECKLGIFYALVEGEKNEEKS